MMEELVYCSCPVVQPSARLSASPLPPALYFLLDIIPPVLSKNAFIALNSQYPEMHVVDSSRNHFTLHIPFCL